MTDPFSGSYGDPGTNPYASGGGAVRTATVNLAANTGNYQQQMGAAAASTNSLNQSVGNLLSRVDHLFKSGGRTLKIVGAADTASLAGATAAAADLQSQMSTLNATASINRTSFKAYGRDVDAVFAKFPSHQGDVVALITELTNLGAKGRDVEALAMTFTKLGAASGENISSLTQSLVQLSRQAGITDSTKISGFANAVLTASKNAGVGVNNVLQFAQSIEPIARQAGIAVPAVLDIATAFTKAGADGFVATNVFNSIVNDITTLTRTGSPELVKYANFIGKTVDQFKRMPAKDQMTGIFAAIAKGGPQALNFVQDLGYGVRQLSALQAVAQGGGLGGTTAATNANDTRNLDRGAHAALSGLDAQWGIVRNQLTRFADLIGGPILAPLTGLAKGFGAFLSITNSVVRALGPLPTIVMGIVALMAPLAGVLMGHAGLIMAGASMRMLTNSGVKASFVAGRAAGAAGESVADTKAATAVMPLWRSRTAYGLGASMGRGFGDSGITPVPAYIGAHRPLGDEAYVGLHQVPPGPPGPGIAGAARLGMFGAIRGVGRGTAGYFNQQARFLNDSTLKEFTRSAYTTPPGNVRASLRNFGTNVAVSAQTQTVGRAIAAEGAVIVRAMSSFAAGTVRAGASLAAAGVGKVTAPIGRVTSGLLPMGMGASLGRAAGGLGRGIAMTAGAAFSMPGLIAMMVGLPMINSFMKKQSADYVAHNETDVMKNLNPLQKYNDALGIATTNLAQFSVGLEGATPQAGVATDKTTFGQASKVNTSDLSKYANRGSQDRNLDTLGKSPIKGKDRINQVKTLLASYQISDPRDLALFGQNMLAAGFSLNETNDVLGSYAPQKVPNPVTAAGAVNAAQGRTRNSKDADALAGAQLGSIERAHTTELNTHTPGYADTHRLSQELQFAGAQAAGVTGAGGLEGLANTFAVITGGKKADFMNLMAPGSRAEKPVLDKNGQPLTDVNGKLVDASGRPLRMSAVTGGKDAFDPAAFKKLSSVDQQKYILKVIGDTKPGRTMLDNVTKTGGVTDPTKMDAFLNTNFGLASASQLDTVKNYGAVGKFINKDPTVQAALTNESATPATQLAATDRMISASMATTGNLGRTADQLQRIADGLGGSGTTAGKALETAAGWARQKEDFKEPYQSREQNLAQAAARVAASGKRANAPGGTAEDMTQFRNDQVAYEAKKADYNSYLISMLQTTREFGVQQVRAEEDYNTQVYRSNRDFHIQMVQSEQDYLIQRGRSLEDFNIQQTRAAQSAAESIYNPYARVQSQSVVNGGMLTGNLQDQNDRIVKQLNQLKLLRSKGLSQSSIDTLRLADPTNAQQVNSIAQSVTNDPATIKRINQLVAARRHATTALTQSQYNEDFRNTVADFTRGLDRTAASYELARKRAVDAQARGLSDMAFEYNKMVTRSGEDLTRQMTQLYGDFASNYADTLASINKDIAKFAPELAQTLIGQVEAAKAAIDAAVGSDSSGGSGSGSGGAPGSATNPSFKAGTLGINPKGQIGTYDAKGGFVAQSTSGMPPAYIAALPHITSPTEPTGSPLSIMKATASRFGWGGGPQWTALNNLEMNEAGYSPTVANSHSGALGLAQALNHGGPQTGGTLGNEYGGFGLSDAQAKAANSGNATWQALWMMNYIKSKYGDPVHAMAQYVHPDGKSWYAEGAIFKGPRVIGIGEKGPEAALPLNARGADFLAGFYDQISIRLASRMNTRGLGQPGNGGGGTSYHQVHEDHRVFYQGDIQLQADDPAAMERKLADRQRLKRLAQPGHSGP